MSKTEKKSKLTARQLKAIPHIVSSHTYTEGCKKAKINKTTLYKWLKEPEFKVEFDRQRDEIAARIHQLIKGMRGRFCDTFVLDNTSNGSVLPVAQVPVRAKVRAKLAPMTLIRCSLVFRSSS